MRGCGSGFGFQPGLGCTWRGWESSVAARSLRDLQRFAISHHAVLTEMLGIELKRPPSDSSFRYFFHQVDVPSLCGATRD